MCYWREIGHNIPIFCERERENVLKFETDFESSLMFVYEKSGCEKLRR